MAVNRGRSSIWERGLSLACLVAGVLLLFTAAGVALSQGGLVRAAYLCLVAGMALVIASVILDPKSAVDLARDRRARFGVMSVLVSAFLIGILGLVNVAASRSTAEVDLTHGGLNTLAPQSVKVGRALDSDLSVVGFYRPDQKQDRNTATALLQLYEQQSPHVKVTFLDADQNAAEARQLGVTIPGSLVFEYRNRPPVVLTLASQTESDVTGAILRLESARTPNICWASGDGERSYQDTSNQNGYSQAKQLLEQHNYASRELLLSQQTQIPATCDVLAVIGPTAAISPAAQKAIGTYLNGGGKLLVAFGPWLDPAVTSSVNAVLDPYQVGFSGGLVADPDPNHQAQGDPTTPEVYNWGSSPITKDLSGKTVLFPHPTAITGSPSGNAADVATTTNSAYQIGQPRDLSKFLGQRAGDQQGPFPLMRTVEVDQGKGRKARIVLVGAPDFAEDLALASPANNQDLLLGTFDWLSQQENLIAISAKPGPQALSVTQQDLYLNAFVTLVLVPGAIGAIGFSVFVRRRRAAA
jgi:ABC-type uncharacterized transport system involved in gliding motility auxiliary subunit